jgi:hypothetical protein
MFLHKECLTALLPTRFEVREAARVDGAGYFDFQVYSLGQKISETTGLRMIGPGLAKCKMKFLLIIFFVLNKQYNY